MLKLLLICSLGIDIAYCHPLSIWGTDSDSGVAPTSMFGRSFGNLLSAIPNPSHITNAIPFLKVRVDEASAPVRTANTQQSYKFVPQIYTETVISKNAPAISNTALLTDQNPPTSELHIEQNPTIVHTVPGLHESNYDAGAGESLPEPVYQQFSEDNNVLILEGVQSTENFGDYSTYTTEDYESTTFDVDVFNRIGAPPAVVASLLG